MFHFLPEIPSPFTLVLISTVFLPLHFQTLKPIATCIRLHAYSGMASDRLM